MTVDKFEALRKAFCTCESNGSEQRYEIRLKFQDLATLQAAHLELICEMLASDPDLIEDSDG